MVKFRSSILSCALLAYLVAGASNDSFDWSSITPSDKLEFHPCLDQFRCARLLLPLDWLNETRSDLVSIAIIKLPAVVSQDDPAYGGAIFTNPGGPGGSGVNYLLRVGRSLQAAIDRPRVKHYDIISFDPRGVGWSEPPIDCFPANSLGRSATFLETVAGGTLDLGQASFSYGYASAKALGQRCENTIKNILPFVNTPSVARDMVAMVDEIDKLRKEETKEYRDDDTQLELRHVKKSTRDVPRLQYIGFSYGTILGNYFASMFPERVGRVVLDGVCNTDDYANGPGWLTNTVDSDRMIEIFFEGCFNAGSETCKLRQSSDRDPSDISKRTWSWIDSLDSEPITASTADGTADVVLRSGDVRTLIGLNLYKADYSFPGLSDQLSEAINGNTGPLATEVLAALEIATLNDACSVGNDTTPPAQDSLIEARSAVLCIDGDDVTNRNITYWRSYMQDQLSVSSILGGLWTTIRLYCAAWHVRPNWAFKGPFTTPTASNPSAPEPGRPAAPLLFLSSRWDPVTPLQAARAMASNHPGAGVLVQESMGHSVLGGGVASECTRKVVSEYFDKGVVPKQEVVCEGVRDPWASLSVLDTQALNTFPLRTRFNHLGV